MKKILAMLLALACVLSFAACASKKTDDTVGEEKPSTSEQTPTEPEAPAEEPDAPVEKPADDENAAKLPCGTGMAHPSFPFIFVFIYVITACCCLQPDAL